MIQNTIKTKKKLSFLFSLSTFITIFLLSLIFYWFINSWIKADQFSKFEMIINSYNDNENSLKDLRDFKLRKKTENTAHLWELNYIILDKNNKIISNFVVSNISLNLQNEILAYKNNNYDKIWNYFVKNIFEKDRRIIFFYELYYSDFDMYLNIFNFFIIAFLSSFIMYFVSRKFIWKVFIPVEKNISNMNEFVNNAWHELQTPLSIIVSNLDFYLKTKYKDDEIIKESKLEAIKMWNLIKELLKLTKENLKITNENIFIYDFVDDILKYYNQNISQKNLNINLNIDKNLQVFTNKEHLFICISNLVSNAIRYNKLNWKIEISFEKKIFKIIDTWIWIEEKNFEKIFERFYKEDKFNKENWFWIGLSLVKNLCELNKWQIWVESQKWIWTTFALKI